MKVPQILDADDLSDYPSLQSLKEQDQDVNIDTITDAVLAETVRLDFAASSPSASVPEAKLVAIGRFAAHVIAEDASKDIENSAGLAHILRRLETTVQELLDKQNELVNKHEQMSLANAARLHNAAAALCGDPWEAVPYLYPDAVPDDEDVKLTAITSKADFVALSEAQLCGHLAKHGGTSYDQDVPIDTLRCYLLAQLGVPMEVFTDVAVGSTIASTVVYRP